MRGGDWDNLDVALRPHKMVIGVAETPEATKIDVTQVNYNTLYIETGLPPAPANTDPNQQTKPTLDLMFLLRILNP